MAMRSSTGTLSRFNAPSRSVNPVPPARLGSMPTKVCGPIRFDAALLGPGGSTVTVNVEEPDHAIVRCFCGPSFQHTDEIFQFSHFSRKKVRVLLSLDTARTDMNKPGIFRKDGDFALSWVRNNGKGRVFYCEFGPQKDVYWNPKVLRHYLAGIQFAIGDLKAPAEPRR